MTRRNGKPKAYPNRLYPSKPDDARLVMAVEDRFLRLCGDYLRIKGVNLLVPSSLDKDIYRWRQVVARHKQGDFRHTEAELNSVKTVAQWTVDQNCDLKGQPRATIEWRD